MDLPRVEGLHGGSGHNTASAVSQGLRLAAAPVFAVMALVTALSGGDLPEGLCLSGSGSSPLTGMVTMYLLMSVFHAAPWLALLRPRGPARVFAFACPAEKGGSSSQGKHDRP
jgi:hypothetical protein